ncbi:MAG: hypothetical protein RIQ93_40 [Verrucomicrobiota bacterium]|jgi:DUF1365 family protein
MHARFHPKAHRFVYRLFLFALDLDELPALCSGLKLFSLGRRNVYSFRDGDYLPTGGQPHNADRPWAGPVPPTAAPALSLKERVSGFLAQHNIVLGDGRVMLVTLPRIFGYGFNPVSFYFCQDGVGRPLAAIAEVTNTFREVKPYCLRPDPVPGRAGEFRLRVPKQFYVSPFSDVDVEFDFVLRTPGDRLSVQIDDYVDGQRTLTSTLNGPRRTLTNARLAWFMLKYPLLTVRIIGLIHWHALRLWLKRAPWFKKSARAEDQRALYRPHGSLSVPASPAAGGAPLSTATRDVPFQPNH